MNASIAKPAARKQLPVKEIVANAILISGRSQIEIAEEMGFSTPNILSMWKKGSTKVNVARAPDFARAVGLDPAVFLRQVIREYTPEILEVMEEYGGQIVSENDRELLELSHKIGGGDTPKMTSMKKSSLRNALKGG